MCYMRILQVLRTSVKCLLFGGVTGYWLFAGVIGYWQVLSIIVLQLYSLLITCLPSRTRHFGTGSQTDKICECLLVVGVIKSVVSPQWVVHLKYPKCNTYCSRSATLTFKNRASYI